MMMCLTSCGAKDFDGKWDCVEAEVDTYGGALSGAYNTIEQNGGVSMLCEVEIDDDDVKYSENLKEFKVVSVDRDDDTIYLTLKGSYGIESVAVLEYDEDEDSITVYHDNNEYTLERADFMHKVVLGMPWWVYLIIGALVLLVIIGKVFAAKNAREAKNRPLPSVPNANIPQYAQRPAQNGGLPIPPPPPPQYRQPQQNVYVQPAQPMQQPRANVPNQQPAQNGYDPNNPFQNPDLK